MSREKDLARQYNVTPKQIRRYGVKKFIALPHLVRLCMAGQMRRYAVAQEAGKNGRS